MAEKNIPVWLHQSPTEKIQIGVAGEVDPETNAQAVDIWPEFEQYEIKNYTIGDEEPAQDAPSEPAAEEPKLLTREEFKARQGKEEQK